MVTRYDLNCFDYQQENAFQRMFNQTGHEQ